MNTLRKKGIKGFTIIELMIVLVIVAILLALAYPSYINYVRKANRGEAQQLLMNWSINQEIWRSNNTEYAKATDDELAAPTNDNYDFDISGRSATAYSLEATAKGDQVNDTARDGTTYCGTTGSLLTLNQSGVKLPAGCWD
jgi:type IV pilus assembly protein PilE